MLRMVRGEVNERGIPSIPMDAGKGQANPTIYGFLKPPPPGGSERPTAAAHFLATSRPLFRLDRRFWPLSDVVFNPAWDRRQ